MTQKSYFKNENFKDWYEEGIIEWLGWIDDIKNLVNTDILCLPSYRRVYPNLLEGAAIPYPWLLLILWVVEML